MLKRVALCALLLLCSPAALRAELTEAERADVKLLIESAQDLRMGERYLTTAIMCCSTPEARPALATALDLFQDLQIEHWRALAFLLHTGTDNEPAKPTFTPLSWHTQAWFHIDRYTQRLSWLQSALTAAKAFHPRDTIYQDSLRRARDIWVVNARATVDRMNPALPFSNPWPTLQRGKTIHTVVGPHGDYRSMHHKINRGKNYAMEAYGALLGLYRGGADGSRIRDAWTESSNMLDTLDHVTGLLADVTFTDEEASEDRFCRTLRATKLLTVTAADRYKRWGDSVARLVPAAYTLLILRLVDSWKHAVDLGTWGGLLFPESPRCTSQFLKQ